MEDYTYDVTQRKKNGNNQDKQKENTHGLASEFFKHVMTQQNGLLIQDVQNMFVGKSNIS